MAIQSCADMVIMPAAHAKLSSRWGVGYRLSTFRHINK